ncbi:MAG: NUDIX domain-containing protein [Patescibacteria group bacterium]|nr:NUDIX domain-containing protein [Patescibacteria group bacterium]
MIIEKDGKFLLVQEAQKERGKWNQPAGWLDLGEDIIEGARREAKEETGLDVEIIGLLGIYPLLKFHNDILHHAIKFIFAAKSLSDKISFDKKELLDAKWFSLDEVRALGENLRDVDIIKEIKDFQESKFNSFDILKPITDSRKL